MISEATRRAVVDAYKRGIAIQSIADMFHISRPSIYAILKADPTCTRPEPPEAPTLASPPQTMISAQVYGRMISYPENNVQKARIVKDRPDIAVFTAIQNVLNTGLLAEAYMADPNQPLDAKLACQAAVCRALNAYAQIARIYPDRPHIPRRIGSHHGDHGPVWNPNNVWATARLTSRPRRIRGG